MGNVLVQRYVPIALRRGKGPLTNAAVARMISKFEATGCLDDRPRSGRPSTRRNAAETVKDEMETVAGSSMHGEVSARAVARRTGFPYTTVWLALRRTLRCYPYKIHRHHELLPGDSVNRRAFAVWAFQKMAEDDDWLSNLLWTDEAHFTLRGSVNTHNCRIWATENPRTVVETPLHDEKVTVWVGFTTSTVIGPFFFEEMRDSGFVTATVTGERYADMLQNRIIPSMADKHLLERTIFMQDSAPPPYC
ncbi:RNA-directed DNA polymerase from mobile element jockey [Trichonephila clavipes]|nr:RNA-directed DNA polymerase from mobile element jockey [Trichonephila clavipes]